VEVFGKRRKLVAKWRQTAELKSLRARHQTYRLEEPYSWPEISASHLAAERLRARVLLHQRARHRTRSFAERIASRQAASYLLRGIHNACLFGDHLVIFNAAVFREIEDVVFEIAADVQIAVEGDEFVVFGDR
jgi:hypothetical protein